jgi:WD40 repeat protein
MVKYSTDGSMIGIQSSYNFRVVEVDTGNTLFYKYDSSWKDFAWHGDVLYVADIADRVFRLFKDENGKYVEDTSDYVYLEYINHNLNAIGIDGDYLVTGTHQQYVEIWDITDDKNAVHIYSSTAPNLNGDVKKIKVLADQKKFFMMTDHYSDTVFAYSFDETQENETDRVSLINRLDINKTIYDYDITADGTKMLAAISTDFVEIYDVATGELLNSYGEHVTDVDGYSRFVRVLPGQKKVVSTCGPKGHVWELETQTFIDSFDTGFEADCGDVHPLNNEVFLGFGEGKVACYSVGGLSVRTLMATNIDYYSMTLNGILADMGGHSEVEVNFAYSSDPSFASGVTETVKQTLTTEGKFSTDISGLNPDNMYYVKATAKPILPTTT